MSNLKRLLQPKSIALLGGIWAENVYNQLKKSQFDGKIWPVHPTKEKLGEHDCYKNLDSLPSPPDATFVGVNRFKTIELVQQLDKMGAGGAVCFASGFSEIGSKNNAQNGHKLQKELISVAANLAILGPNCYGFLNYLDNITLWPDQHGGHRVKEGVAIIAQSSNIAINLTMQKRSLPIAYVLTVGNQAKSGISDLIDVLLEDTRVTAIGFYIEGFDNVQNFETAATKAAFFKKPLVVLKAGKTDHSMATTLSHTASIAGSNTVGSAFLKRLGCIEVSSLSNLLETLKVFHFLGYLKEPNIASVSCSGGEASLIADQALGTQIQYKPFKKATKENLETILGSIVTVSNPFDYHTFIWGDVEKMTKTFSTVLENPFELVLFLLDVPRNDICDDTSFQCAIEAIIKTAKNSARKVAVVASLPESMPEALAKTFISSGVIPLCGIDDSIQAINNAILLGQFYEKNTIESQEKVYFNGERLTESIKLINEKNSKDLLKSFGLKVPKSISAKSVDQAMTLIESNNIAFPVAVKGLNVPHKTENNLVKLNIKNTEALRKSLNDMFKRSNDILVEEMILESLAELSIGIMRDDIGVFLLTIGAGGILTELFNQRVNLILPVTNKDIELALSNLPISNILDGYRGAAPVNKKKIVEAIQALSRYTQENLSLISEIEINPLIVGKTYAMAADILLTHALKESRDEHRNPDQDRDNRKNT
ncbi:MAG: acetate--CoA ligase family protein [Paracoccaceae bacterium]|nr:acetate--CoA ligase family protein [Paracoccaceae bacterium]